MNVSKKVSACGFKKGGTNGRDKNAGREPEWSRLRQFSIHLHVYTEMG